MNKAAEHQSSTPMTSNRKGRVRDMPTPRQMPVLDFLVLEAANNDAELEETIVIVVAGMRDGSIKPDVGQELLIHLFASFRNNDHMHDVLAMMRDNAIEVPLAEVDRVLAVRAKLSRNGVTKK